MRNLQLPGRSVVYALNGMAATSHPLSTGAAVEVLKSGGNAMDAAVTACAVQCVVEPQSTAIGGDCFCLYAAKGGGDVVAFNGSGRAAAAAHADWYAERGITGLEPYSPHAVTVPGAIDAWDRLLADHGTIGLGEALAPAIRYAREGYVLGHRVQGDWALQEQLLARHPSAAAIYLTHGGHVPPVGAVHYQHDLAGSLETLARHGRDAFYTGPLAEKTVAHLASLGGLQSLDDFAAHRGDYVTPVRTTYRGHEVVECPPNGQGIVALQMLNMFSGLNLGGLAPLSAERLHLEIETARLAYRDRDAMLADPAMSDQPVEYWLSERHAAKQRALIDRDRALAPLPPSDFPNHEDTVYISVVDKDLNAVSFINSLFSSFGTAIVPPGTGILLHNRGRGFSLKPGHPNAIAPGKRPLHTIIPGMVLKDGRAHMPFGVMGGQYQPCGHAHFLSNLYDFGMDLQEAIDCPRVFPNPGGKVDVESGVPDSVRGQLAAMGHDLADGPPAQPLGGAQAIVIDHEAGVLAGASEPRKDGMAMGY